MGKMNFIPVSELTDRIPLSSDAIYKYIKREKIADQYYRYVDGLGRGGRQLEVNPLGLPEPHRSNYIRDHFEANDDLLQQQMDAEAYAKAPDYAKEHANLWLNLIQQFGELKGKELKGAIRAWKQSHPEEKVSLKSFYRYRKAYEEEGLTALIPNYGNRRGDSKTTDEDYELFEALYLKESRPSAESCWNIVRGQAFKEGRDVSDFPTARTFLRRLENEHSDSTIYFARYGEEAWNKKYADYVDRDKSDIPANAWWVGDHRVIDLFVINEETGKIFRPWCTAWMDFKTNKFISIFNHEADPNSDHIFQSFKWGIEKFGRPGEGIYIDNGKDYRSKDFAGGRKHQAIDDEAEARTLVSLMGIKAQFSLPYNAQSKNIERAFRGFIEYLEKHLPGYTGSHPKDRPESTKELVKKGELMTFKKFDRLFNQFVFEVLNKKASQGKELQGRSPDEAFYSEYKKKIAIRPETLRMFCMRTSREATIMRNGVKDGDLGKYYYAEWMMGFKGTKVYLRRDIKAYQEAWVFAYETNEFLGKAQLADTISGFVSSDIEKAKLREIQKRKRKEVKMHKKRLAMNAQPSPEEILDALTYNIKAEEKLRLEKGDFNEYSEKVPVIQMDTTKMDEVIKKDEKMQRTGTDDLSDFVPDDSGSKKSLKSIWDED
ncbi:transposase domain-containing protein [Gracilimonas tropica]|uniref:transposase domain-containing protein n=1 Tax=Gracilimonas tropica TaxID=454600 RepID=UPI000367E9F2|nr:transposase domain-containing protein [Gracilimonas tropica]